MKSSVFEEHWIVEDMIRELRGNMVEEEVQLPVWSYRKCVYNDPFHYSEVDKGIIHIGEIWDAHHTYYFSVQVSATQAMIGHNVYLYLSIGGEAIVSSNGTSLGSLDMYHDDVLLTNSAVDGEHFDIVVQANYHAQNFIRSQRANSQPYPLHCFKEAKLVTKNRDVQRLSHLAEVLFKLVQTEADVMVSKPLYSALKDALLRVEFHGSREIFLQSVKEANQTLSALSAKLKPSKHYGTLYTMGHSHLDLVFKWRWKETVRKIERTLTNAVTLLERYPEARFTQSQAVIFDEMQRSYPELFKTVRRLIDEERIEAVGNLWVEPDTNIPAGESLIRQILFGSYYFRQELNRSSRICFLPDTFGYTGILPQILVQCGYHYFVTSKLYWNDTNPFPHRYFNWKGIDGTEMKSYLIREYGGRLDVETIRSRAEDDPAFIGMVQYGFGDGGGGISEFLLEEKKAIDQLPGFVKIIDKDMGSALKAIDAAYPEIPLVQGELYLERHRGVYTSQSKIKRYNRQCELLYRNAEFLASLQFERGLNPLMDQLRQGWKKVLFNQFHDIISGSSITEAIYDAWQTYEEAIEIGSDLLTKFLGKSKNESEEISLFAVWNTLGWDRTGYITLHSLQNGTVPCNEKGPFAVQLVQTDTEGISEFLVEINDVPSFGNTTIEWKQEKFKEPIEPITPSSGDPTLENEHYRILFDDNGEIASLWDKALEREVLTDKGNVLRAFVDRPGYFDSWDINVDFERVAYDIQDVTEMHVTETGPLRWTMRIQKQFRDSTIIQYISIHKHTRRIDFRTEMDFHESQFLIKAEFPVDVISPYASYDLSMGHIRRSTKSDTSEEKARFEVVAHKWVDLSQDDFGVSLLNDCKYGHDIKGNRIRITLLKTGIFPDPVQDIGHHTFTYSLLPHAGSLGSETVREAYELNVPLLIGGSLEVGSSRYQWVSLDTESVILDTIKPAEDGRGVILRLYESLGKTEKVKLTFADSIKHLSRCDLLENDQHTLPFESNRSELSMKPFEIVTLRLER